MHRENLIQNMIYNSSGMNLLDRMEEKD